VLDAAADTADAAAGSARGGAVASPVVLDAAAPSQGPSAAPSQSPSAAPSQDPSAAPSQGPSAAPSLGPSAAPDLVLDLTRFKHHYTTYTEQKRYFEQFVAKVSGKGYAVLRREGGCAMKKEKPLRDDYGDVKYQEDGVKKNFLKRWLKDEHKRGVTKVDFTPSTPGKPLVKINGVMNLFRGFGETVAQQQAPASTSTSTSTSGGATAQCDSWRAVGKELCGGNPVKFNLLEQWCAHMIQFPAERTDIYFAFAGAPKGKTCSSIKLSNRVSLNHSISTDVLKDYFFKPLAKILGEQNYLETSDIHKVVDSSKNKCEVACKLLVVLNGKKTSRFKEEIKATVTEPKATVSRSREKVTAYHRLVVFSDVDEQSGEQCLLLHPTGLTESLPSYDTVQTHELFTHLSSVQVTHRNPAAWKGEVFSLRHRKPAPHIEWLYDITKSGAWPFQVDKVNGVYKCEPYQGPRVEDDPLPHCFFDVKISKRALFRGFEADCGKSLKQTKFSQDIGGVLVKAGGSSPPRTNGETKWIFKTRDVRVFLAEKYPALVEDTALPLPKPKLDAAKTD
jgi:hypothetical protein